MFTCLVLSHTLYGFVENVIVVGITTKVGNRSRCGGRVMHIARKVLYSREYLYAHILNTW